MLWSHSDPTDVNPKKRLRDDMGRWALGVTRKRKVEMEEWKKRLTYSS